MSQTRQVILIFVNEVGLSKF